MVRRRRMQGYRTLWLPGMDHAGIATQNVVERELAKDGLSRHDLGREAFVERVWQWKTEYGGRILGQMRRLGDSVDWSRERFTMDEGLSRAVQTIFKRLFDDELIYRAERIINWCPRCLTALSDIEVDHTDDEGELVSIRYGDGEDSIVVATTRAETMLGDTAVAVHPDDERYRPPGRHRRRAPADRPGDPDRGRRARGPRLRHRRGQGDPRPRPERLRDRPPPRPAGRADHGRARRDHRARARSRASTGSRPARRSSPRSARPAGSSRRSAPTCTRSGTAAAAAPRSSRASRCSGSSASPRWRRRPGDAVRDGRVALSPTEMNARYFGWVDDMHDWCISRQLWWGHRIPVWYSPDGEVRCVGPNETAARRAGPRTPTSSTPGSPARCGRSPPSAGPTTPPTCAPSTRRACS